jgi:hypothetical protein
VSQITGYSATQWERLQPLNFLYAIERLNLESRRRISAISIKVLASLSLSFAIDARTMMMRFSCTQGMVSILLIDAVSTSA